MPHPSSPEYKLIRKTVKVLETGEVGRVNGYAPMQDTWWVVDIKEPKWFRENDLEVINND